MTKKQEDEDDIMSRNEFYMVFYERAAQRAEEGPCPTDAEGLRARAKRYRQEFEEDMARMRATNTVPPDLPPILARKKK